MPSIRHSLKINLRHLVDPRGAANGGLFGVNPGVAFEVYRWMIATAAGYRDQYRHCSSGPWEYLLRKPSCTGCSPGYLYRIGGTGWAETLRRSFQLALLCNDSWCLGLGRWRKANKLDTLGTISVPIRHYRPADPWGTVCRTDAFTHLMSLTGKWKTSPNEFHRRAKTVYGVCVITYVSRHVIVARYGYSCDKYSSWQYELAAQGKSECFDDTANRAIAEAARLIDGKVD